MVDLKVLEKEAWMALPNANLLIASSKDYWREFWMVDWMVALLLDSPKADQSRVPLMAALRAPMMALERWVLQRVFRMVLSAVLVKTGLVLKSGWWMLL
jgi:hypothetical protein